MSIEIKGGANLSHILSGKSQQSGAVPQDHPGGASRASAPSSSGSDTFSLTNRASQLQQLETQIANLPIVDTQRVNEVQHALATGTMQIKPERVADKLLTFEIGLARNG